MSQDDEPLRPDAVTGPDDESNRLDQLAERAVDSVLHLVRRANALAGGVLLFVVVCSIGGFLLGLAALSDGARTVWIALGGFFAFISIGAVISAMLRLMAVRRASARLVTEFRALIAGDVQTERTVRSTVSSAESKSDDGIVDLSREFSTMRSTVVAQAGQFRALAMALTAVTTFPGLIAIATLIAFVFAGLSLFFVAALLL